MKKCLFTTLLCASFFSVASASTPSQEKIVQQVIQPFMQKNQIHGAAVEMIVHGVPHAYYFGYANAEQKTPVTGNSIFEIGSLTKIFTSVIAAEEIQSGNLDWNASIRKYIPDLTSKKNAAIYAATIENLATHTSGVPLFLPDTIKTPKQLRAYFQQWKPAYPIGTEWQYSSMGIGLLGYCLEAVMHENYNQMYRERILQPLHMTPIGIVVPANLLSDYAQGYDINNHPVGHMSLGLFPAAAGIKVSANDMLHFLSAALHLPGTPPAIEEAMRMTQTPYYRVDDFEQGMAWEIHPRLLQKNWLYPSEQMKLGPLPAKLIPQKAQRFDGDALIDKTGQTRGFRAYIAVIPNEQSGIVILVNKTEIPNGEITRAGRKILLQLI